MPQKGVDMSDSNVLVGGGVEFELSLPSDRKVLDALTAVFNADYELRERISVGIISEDREVFRAAYRWYHDNYGSDQYADGIYDRYVGGGARICELDIIYRAYQVLVLREED